MDTYHTIIDSPKYEINKNGCVRRVYKNGNITYPKHTKYKNGYIYVRIHSKNKLLHRLLGLTFIPNPENKPFIDHINCIRDDNSIENLRWATKSENSRNTIRENKGCLHERYDKVKKNDGTITVYKYYRFEYYPDYNIKTSRSFKTLKEAEDFRDTIYPPHK
jgi:hypothetical protein